MKKFFLILIILLGVLTIFASDISGKIENDFRLFVFEKNIFMDKFYVDMEYKKNFNEKFDFNLCLQIESDYPFFIKNIEDMTEKENFYKNLFKIYEAKIFLKKFPFDFVDLTLGKTFYNLGKGFVVSPSDIVNSDDLSDPLRMDKKVTNFMVLLESYFKFFDLNIIYTPFFTPSILPDGYIDFKDYMGNLNIKDSIILPENIFQNSDFFVEFLKDINNFQTSFFYGYSRTKTPLPSNIKLEMVTPFSGFGDVKFNFPRISSFGLGFSGAFGDFSLWSDFVGNFLNENRFKIDLTEIGRGVVDTFFAKEKIFFNFLLGFDFNISGKYYFMTQYVHGIRGTYGEENLNDYLFFNSRISFLNEKIFVEPFNFAYEIVDWKEIKSQGGILFNPKITLNLMDDFSIGFSFFYIKGTSGSYFKKIEKLSCFELTTKVFF
ncbi:MAG: hypothetical protein WHT27_05920 [candidate division WOR-3 bacterium]